MTHPALPEIERNGYRLDSVSRFLDVAPPESVARYRREFIGRGFFIVWDTFPEENSDGVGYMDCRETVAQIHAAFLAHFGEALA